jgi:hypothetical protein
MNEFLNPDLNAALSINVENATNKPKYVKRSEDTRFIKVSIQNPQKTYQAVMRLLPQGIEGLKNQKPFYVKQMVHYIKEGGKTIVEKCRKTLGEEEHCPFCEANWAMYNLGKKNNDEAMKKRATARAPVTSYIANFYVRQDGINPNNNGKVVLYEYRQTIQDLLMIPIVGEKKTAPDTLIQGINLNNKPEVGRFVPYNPVQSKDLYLIVNEDPKTTFPSYISSTWANEFSSLAQTEEQIIGILNQCYDLNEFTSDVKSVEAMTIRLNDLVQEFPSMFVIGGASPAQAAPQHNNISQMNASQFLQNMNTEVPPLAPMAESIKKPTPVATPEVDPAMVNLLAQMQQPTQQPSMLSSLLQNGVPQQEISAPALNDVQSAFSANVDSALQNDSDDDDLPF